MMKNPFIQRHAGSKRGFTHKNNPAGTKMLRGFYRAKHGRKGTADEAKEWYSELK